LGVLARPTTRVVRISWGTRDQAVGKIDEISEILASLGFDEI
jgi:hypothetical protein